MANPLAEVSEIYEPGLDLSGVTTQLVNEKVIPELDVVISDIDVRVNKLRGDLGLDNVKPIMLPQDDAIYLRLTIQNDPAWKQYYARVIELCAPEGINVSLEDQIRAISIPWWNLPNLTRIGDNYQPGQHKLTIAAGVVHSYLTQLRRAKIGPVLDSMSISGVFVTEDGWIPLGYRKGRTYSATLMTVPAGSVDCPKDDRSAGSSAPNPVAESVRKEHLEELGLAPKDYQPEIIGRVYDYAVSANSLYVCRARGGPLNDVLRAWNKAIDQREHRWLIPYDASNPDHLVEEMMKERYNPAMANQKTPSDTTLDNVGKILPPCAVSILCHFAQQLGAEWVKKLEQSGILQDVYAFKH